MFFWSILIGMPVLDAIFWWWADRRLRPLPRSGWYRVALAAFMIFQLSFYGWMILHRVMDVRIVHPVIPLSLAFVWHLLILPITMAALAIWTILAQGSRLLGRLFQAIKSRKWEQSSNTLQMAKGSIVAPQGPTRRQFLAAMAVAAPPLLTGGSVAGAMLKLNHFRVQTIDLPIAGLSPVLEGLRIAHISDLHNGRFTTTDMMEQIVARTNAMQADLVCFTGDLIDFSIADLPAAAAMLKRINPGSGMFLCEGNHDMFESRKAFDQGVTAAGLRLLVDEQQSVIVRGQEVRIAGISWAHDGTERQHARVKESVRQAVRRRVQPNDPLTILLAHHPHAFDLAADMGVPLTLSGHTHGGQLMLTPDLGAGSMMYRYWSGVYELNDKQLVVSNGVGNWFPLRINAPAEIALIRLHRTG